MKHRMTLLLLIFITLLDFCINLKTPRLFDADCVIFPVHINVSSNKENKRKRKERKFKKKKSNFINYILLSLRCVFVREMIQIQFGYVKTVRRKRILEFI